MITLYAASSPNAQKIILMLEETGLPYRIEMVNVHEGAQLTLEFLALNPNAKIPVIVDPDGPNGAPHTVFESGAILIYLADKARCLLPAAVRERSVVLQWLMIQMTGIGPTFGQFNHFVRFAPEVTYALDRFISEMRRLYDLLDERLRRTPYLGGEDYSIADVATFPWIRTEAKLFGDSYPVLARGWPDHPALGAWFDKVEQRPAARRAMAEIDARPSTLSTASPQQLDRYFGRGAFARRLDPS